MKKFCFLLLIATLLASRASKEAKQNKKNDG